MNKKQIKKQPSIRNFSKKGGYLVWIKRISILCLAVFSASFLYYFIAPSPTTSYENPVKKLPKDTANKVREVFGMEVPQETLGWWATIKSVITLRNAIKFVVVVVAIFILYKGSGWIYGKFKTIKWNELLSVK